MFEILSGIGRLSMETVLLAKHLLAFFLLLISLTLHEWAHAWVAYRCGDETPKAAGRVTLNPLAHIDLFGTVLFPLICIFSQSGLLFGWGKVVPMNPRNFDRRWKFLLAGGAGIFGNLLLCFIASLLFMGKSCSTGSCSCGPPSAAPSCRGRTGHRQAWH